jgi:hypothetical protein
MRGRQTADAAPCHNKGPLAAIAFCHQSSLASPAFCGVTLESAAFLAKAGKFRALLQKPAGLPAGFQKIR